MNDTTMVRAIAARWDDDIVPQLIEYIRIPAKSPHFDSHWQANGHIERAIGLAETWARRQPVRNLALEIVRLPGRTPLIYFDVPGTAATDRTVLLYGHLDKQPEMVGWRDGYGPCNRPDRRATLFRPETFLCTRRASTRPSQRC